MCESGKNQGCKGYSYRFPHSYLIKLDCFVLDLNDRKTDCFTGSEQESVKVHDLRGFLKSEVFTPGKRSTAVFAENGRNPRLRHGNDAPGDPLRLQTGVSHPYPLRLETRTQRGFPQFHSDDGCGLPFSNEHKPR